MFHIHKKIEYALTALKYIKGKKTGELTTAREICDRFDIPFDPTSRVLQIMTQHEILQAVQGAYGGYRLVGNLTRLTLYDLSMMIVGSLSITDCSAKGGSCDRSNRCTLQGAMARLNGKMLAVLKGVNVSEMV